MQKRPIAHTNASLKIVPYYVMKNPSEPSLIGSAISYMLLGPTSLSRIQPSIHMLIPMKSSAMIKAENAIKFDYAEEMQIEKAKMQVGPARTNAALTGKYASAYIL